jgi:hypothetical protein
VAPTVSPVTDGVAGRHHASNLVRAFAEKVVRPGANALLLNEDNTADHWTTIGEAVQSRRAFAVDVADDLLAIDCDRPELVTEVMWLAEQLRIDGYPSVLVNSGRPTHCHLFCRIVTRGLLERYKARARAVGLDVRRAIRPPLAPHRLGLSVSLLSPDDPAAALARLTPATARPLSPRITELLRNGDREGRYAKRGKRSTVVMAIVTGMVSSGWALDEGFRALRDRANRGGEKVQGRTEDSAWRYVAACWTKAEVLVARQPAIRDRAGVLRKIVEVRAAVEAQRWKGTTGATDRRVMEAHLRIATRTGKVVYGAAVRTVAELAGCGLEAVVNAHTRLRHQGWLKLVTGARSREGLANVWSLRIPRGGDKTEQSDQHHAGRVGLRIRTVTSPLGGDERDCAVSDTPTASPHQDVWRRGALGGHAWRVWSSLAPRTSRSSRHIADLLGLEQPTVRRCLARLGRHGLAVHAPDWYWRRGAASPEEVAGKLGVTGAGERQRCRHVDQRRAHRMSIDWERRQGFRP